MVAVSYEFEQLVESGDLPFDGAWEFFARPTGRHFVMRTQRALITTSQVAEPKKKPRRATFRSNYAELNEVSLLHEINEEQRILREEAEREGGRRLIHILHGYQGLEFSYLTYPHPAQNRHIYSSPNLLAMPHIVSDLPPQEGPSESPDPEALERLEKHFRDDE